MTVYLGDIKPMVLNKTQFFLPINEEDKKKNSAIFLLTPNLESSINTMKHPLALNRKLFESYYIEKDISFVINEAHQLVRSDVMPLYESMLGQYKHPKLSLKSMNESISEKVYIKEIFKTPKELSSWMKTNIRYKDHGKLLSAKEVYEKKSGNCHDQVIFEKYIFSKMGIDHNSLFFIEYNESNPVGGMTHTLLYYKENGKLYWFENAWGGEEGIHGPYGTIKDLKNDIIEKHKKMSSYNKFPNLEFAAVKNIKPGMGLNDYVQACLEQSSIMNESVEDIIVEDYTLLREDYILTEDFIHTNYELQEQKFFFGDSVESILEDNNPKADQYSAMMRKLLYSERIKNQKECILIHDKVKADLDFIRYTYINYALYKQRNLFIDWSYYTQSFFKNNTYKLDRAVDLYFEFLHRFLSDIRLDDNGYKVKTVFIPVLDWMKKDILAWDYTKDVNPISMIYRLLKRKSTILKDMWSGYNFVFLSDKAYFKLDFNEFDDTKLPVFTFLINRLVTGQVQDAELEQKDSTKAIVHKIIDKIEGNGVEIANLTGGSSKLSADEIQKKMDMGDTRALKDTPKDEVEDEKKALLVTQIKNTADKSTSEDNTMENLNNDMDSEWTKQLIIDLQSEGGPNINAARKARINTLRDDFSNKKINGTKIEDLITKNKQMTELETDVIPIDSINEEWKDVKFTTFSKNYDLDSDIYAMLADLSSKSDPIMVISIDRKDNSTSEDYIETWDIKFEDANGKRFSVKLDIPKFINDRYMKLRGNLKVISGQLVLIPIIKTDEDTAQIVSCSYNKIFIKRINPSGGSKTTRVVSMINKSLSKYEGTKIKVYEGDNSFVSSKYELPIEYRDLSGLYSRIELPDGSYFSFNMDDMKKIPLAYPKEDADKIPIYVNKDGKAECCTGEVGSFMLYKLLAADPEYAKIFDATKPDKRLSYTTASILNTDIPVIVVMSYSEGLQAAMTKGGVKFSFSDKRPSPDTPYIKFSDGYIIYDHSVSSSLLMSGLNLCDTSDYSIKDINKKEMWLDFLDNFGGRIKADGLDNFYDLMFDPTTKEVCELYHLPTDYIEGLGYASNLLTDTKYNKHVDISGNRIRTNEIVAGYVYKAISKGYGEYKTQLKRNKKDASLTLKQSAVIDNIFTDPTSKDLSILNPLLEAEANNEMSFKGLSGMNSDRSYSLDKRTYDDSMMGVIASSTGFAANVGITRQATINSSVQGSRGLIVTPKSKDINTLNTLCVTEALTPFGVTHDDPIRTAMAFIQTSKHQMRTKKSSPNLVTMGMDEALPYITSDIFSHKFRGKKGKVIEITDEYLLYEDSDTKKRGYIDLRETVMKNSDGGFYVTVKLDPYVKKGDTLKYNDILAYDKSSFSKAIGTSKSEKAISYNIGTMAKIAIMTTDEAYEDSAIIDNYLSDALTSTYCIKKDRALSKDTNVYNVVKKGDVIEEGDPLIVFQNAFDEKDANALLKSITDDDVEAVSDLGRIHVRSKMTGWIQDIRISRTCELDDLSPSLKKLVTEYEKNIQKTKKLFKANGIEGMEHMLEPDYKLAPTGKLKGVDDGVLIEFFIKCEDKFGIGDKLVYNSAIKGVGKDIFSTGDEPYTDFRPDEKVNALLTVSSVKARMVGSILLNGALNKYLVELDRKCKEMLGIPWKNLEDM